MTEQEELELLKQNSPYALPDDPSASGWSTDQIKKKFYSGLVILYNFFKQSRNTQNSMIQAMQELVNEINASYSAITSQETILKVKYDMDGNEIVNTYAKLLDIANGTVAACKYISEDGTSKKFIYELENALATLTTNFNLVKEWADNIKSATSQEAVQRAVSATKDSLGNIIKDTYATVGSFSTVANNIANIIDGTTIVGKAYKDQNGNVINTTYATKAALKETEDKVPSQASSSNQLADKEFVNSSISTATATYRGSYNLVSDLSLTIAATEAQIITALSNTILVADNNDYCYVRIPTANDNTTQLARVDRYKNNGSSWAFEYALNNSGYTSEQWTAINSGITQALVAKIRANETAITNIKNGTNLYSFADVEAALLLKQANLTFDNVPTAGSNNPVTSEGVKKANDSSLYNLGSFDSVSGNTITRQTGYKKASELTYGAYNNSYSLPLIWCRMPSDFVGTNLYQNDDMVASVPKNNTSVDWSALTANTWRQWNYNNGVVDVAFIFPSGTTEAQGKAILETISIQYKLSTSYTESIIPNQPLLNLDSNGCNFLRNEYEKGLNLTQIITLSGYFSSGQQSSLFAFGELEIGKTYTISLTGTKTGTNVNNGYGGILLIQSDTKEISGIYATDFSNAFYKNEDINANVNETFIATKKYLLIVFGGTGNYSFTGTISNPMLNEGTHPYPYQEYNGEIVHKVDIEPVLLWENSSPNSAFASGNITTQDMSKYKYIVIEYSRDKNGNYANTYSKNKYAVSTTISLFYITTYQTNTYMVARDVAITNNTTITFGNGTINGQANNDQLIPVAIYGTNVL